MCFDCPRKAIEENFKAEAEELTAEWLGVKAEKFRFEEIKSTILSVRNLTEMSKNQMTVKTAGLLAVYHIEENRFNMVKDA